LNGFARAMREFGLEPEGMSESLSPQSSVPLGCALLGNLLARHPDLEAVFCCDDNLSLGALFECQRRNIPVPGQISLMGFNDLEFAACASPSLSSISTPRYEMGKQTAGIVLSIISGGQGPVERRIDVGFSITRRESTAPRLHPDLAPVI
jgi:LacI family transcriptional regulator, gluconate utilization system Gnt-I transcriptional repressor